MKLINSIIFNSLFLIPVMLLGQQNLDCVGDQGNVIWYVYDNIPDNELQDLYVDPSYPLSPTYELNMLSLESTYNFNNWYGSVLRGFIKVPETGEYTFNVTGNDRASFYMSSGTDPADLALTARTQFAIGKYEHNEYTEQTSSVMNLTKDDYHYFELHHKEHMYSDHATVFWKTPLYTDTLWRVVNASNLYEYTCFSTCPPQGTACNDGNANTFNDVEDGYCNCIGEINSSNSCIGNRGDALALFYENIPGSDITDLYNAPNYPLSPDTAIEMSNMKMPYNFGDEYGTLVKGYLKVPESGRYTFNVTGDDNVRFYFSTDDSPNNINLIAEVDGWTGTSEHYKYPSQTSVQLTLNQSDFYYFELHHKEGGGGDHSNIYWKTPFRPDTNWMALQGLFIYGYDCELACPPVGTACNDHNDNTENDAYDANCDCVGTPCSGPCNQGNNYVEAPLCAPSEDLSNNMMDAWLSCEETASPNAARGSSHWIMYDFGEILEIERNRFWNYNVENETGKGGKTVIIDYANNTNNWTNLGTYQWAQAPGTNGYSGDSTISLNGIRARYLLYTITESWNSTTCAGFSEILFDIRRCRPGGTECDDGDPYTINDMYDNDCNCIGIPEIIENPCDVQILTVNDPAIPTDDYNAEDKVIGIGNVPKGHIVTFTAANAVELNSDFEVKKGALFYASIEPCVNPLPPLPGKPINRSVDLSQIQDQSNKKEFLRLQDDQKETVKIQYQINRKSVISLSLQNSSGETVFSYKNGFMRPGYYEKMLPTRALAPDIYHIVLQTKNNIFRQRIVVTQEHDNSSDPVSTSTSR